MQINVKMLNGSTFPIEVAEENTVMDLKRMLVDKCGWEPQDQKLIYLGRVLQDEQTCRTANLKDGIAIHLVHKPRPVDPPSNNVDDPMAMGDHPMEEDHHEGPHPIIFEAPSVHGIQSVPVSTPVDPLQRLQAMSRLAERIATSRVTQFERAYAHRGMGRAQPRFESNHYNNSFSTEVSPTQSASELEPTGWIGTGLQANIQPRRARVHGTEANGERVGHVRLYRNVMVQALRLAERLFPFADILSQAARSEWVSIESAQHYQTAFNQLNMALHELAHLFHGLSDISLDFQIPLLERTLTISPRIQIERQALLSAAVTIPMNAVGLPNIGNLIAQHLDQLQNPGATSQGFPASLIAGFVNAGFSTMSHHDIAVNSQNASNNPLTVGAGRPISSVSSTNNTSAPGRSASLNNSAPQPQPAPAANANSAQALRDDHFRTVSQTIADHVSSLNAANSGNGSSRDTVDQSDLARILPCTSPLNRSYTSEIPAMSPDSVSNFSTRYMSQMEFASDLLSLASHPLALQLMECIHDTQPEPDLQRGAELALAKEIARRLVSPFDAISPIYITYTEDGVNYVSVLRDLKMRLRDVVMDCLRQLKNTLGQSLPRERRFGIMEVFHFIAPRVLQDLKCIHYDDDYQGKRYILEVVSRVFPYDACGIKIIFEEELLRYYKEADLKLSKYYGKLRYSEKCSSSGAFEPEEEDDA